MSDSEDDNQIVPDQKGNTQPAESPKEAGYGSLRESLSPPSSGEPGSDDDESEERRGGASGGTSDGASDPQTVPGRIVCLGKDPNALPSRRVLRTSRAGGADAAIEDSPPSETSSAGETLNDFSSRSGTPSSEDSESSAISHSEYSTFGEDDRKFRPEEILPSSGSNSSDGSGSNGDGSGENGSEENGSDENGEKEKRESDGGPAFRQPDVLQGDQPSANVTEGAEGGEESEVIHSPLFKSPSFPGYTSPPTLSGTPSLPIAGTQEGGNTGESAEDANARQKKKKSKISLGGLLEDLHQHRRRSEAILGSAGKASSDISSGNEVGGKLPGPTLKSASEHLEQKRADYEHTAMEVDGAQASVQKAIEMVKTRKLNHDTGLSSVEKSEQRVLTLEAQLVKSRSVAGTGHEEVRRNLLSKLENMEAKEKNPESRATMRRSVDAYLEKELTRKRNRMDEDEAALALARQVLLSSKESSITASAQYSAAKKYKKESELYLANKKREIKQKQAQLEESGGQFREVVHNFGVLQGEQDPDSPTTSRGIATATGESAVIRKLFADREESDPVSKSSSPGQETTDRMFGWENESLQVEIGTEGVGAVKRTE